VRVALVGAGIVGVTTAYELAALGHEVSVFERRGSVAEEASFANGGILAPGSIAPWAAPGEPSRLLRQWLGPNAALRLGGAGALAQLPWLWHWWRACRPAVHQANRLALHQLAGFSRDRMLELTRTLRLEFEQMPGWLVLLRGARELHEAQGGLALLRELGVAHDVVDPIRARQIEPGLATGTELHAAIHLAQDGVGNCRQFAQALKAEAQRLGARFQFDTEVRSLAPGTRPALQLAGGEIHEAEAIVVCAGAQANALLAGIGCGLPLAAVHGYSVTAPLRHLDGHGHNAPRAALRDERFRVAIARLGQRVRVSGGAELGGSAARMHPATLRTLYKVLDDWFPGAALVREAQQWKGARPMLPDGPPVLGESGAPGVWLNLGHGASGWVLACGSARVLAERISGRAAPLDCARLGLARLRGAG